MSRTIVIDNQDYKKLTQLPPGGSIVIQKRKKHTVVGLCDVVAQARKPIKCRVDQHNDELILVRQ